MEGEMARRESESEADIGNDMFEQKNLHEKIQISFVTTSLTPSLFKNISTFFYKHTLYKHTNPVFVRLIPSAEHEAVLEDDNFVLLPLIGGHQQLHSANS
jgi:hypothetical protein